MEAKRDIEDIFSLHKTGMNFDTLALTYSQDANSNQEGGDLGFIERGDLEPEMEKVVFENQQYHVAQLIYYGKHLHDTVHQDL